MIHIGKKKSQEYKGLLIKADLQLHEQIAEKLNILLKRNSKILDFGAGEGALTYRLADMGYEVIAVDKDQDSYKCKKAKFYKLDFDSQEEVENFVLNHQSEFDAVLGVEVIEHVHDQWRYIEHLLLMLKPGGIILVTTPNITSWLSRVMFFLKGRFHQFEDEDLEYGHINPITSWQIELIMKQSNLENINIEKAGVLPAIYLTGLNRVSLLSILLLPFRLFMKGRIDGWCIMATGRKPE